MSSILRLPNFALGDVERDVLERLWSSGPGSPEQVHAEIGVRRGISVKTVASALKRLHEKGLLRREKVSHSYVYEASVSRGELQRFLIDAIAREFGTPGRATLLAAFVDVAEDHGRDTLHDLERLVSERLVDEG